MLETDLLSALGLLEIDRRGARQQGGDERYYGGFLLKEVACNISENND